MTPSSASRLIHSLRKRFTALIVRNFASEDLGKIHLLKHYLVVLPRSMDCNDAVADSLVALWTAIMKILKEHQSLVILYTYIRLSVTLTLFDCKSISLLAT